eukprot:COSAG02_NODE_2830_length_7936_cov_40.231849_4_plen_42_part_00
MRVVQAYGCQITETNDVKSFAFDSHCLVPSCELMRDHERIK